jgi:hypothetical protein
MGFLPGSRFSDAFNHHPVGQWNGERDSILGAEVSRDVSLASRVFDEVEMRVITKHGY